MAEREALNQNGNAHVGIEIDALNRRTRFQVNRVDAQDESQNQNDEQENDERGRLYSESYDTKYAKSFRHLTREALPRADNYRNIMSIHAAHRPTLDELHDATLHGKERQQIPTSTKNVSEGILKFGWIQGVLIRCLLNIWGVMLFLRLSWVVGQAGIGLGFVIILGASVVTTITSLSMSAISTNGVIKGGGTYYMISRSLGPEFGGSIGLIFSTANAVACAMYVVGFCESLLQLLNTYGLSIVDGKVQDTRIIGCITIVVLLGIVTVGMEWEAKTQLGLLVILMVAIFDFILGTFIGPKSNDEMARGFMGFNSTIFKQNFGPSFRKDEDGVQHDFFSVFSIFFPAATGILAGANISGDLADPQRSIPKGTLLAVFITTLSYILIALLSGWTVMRDVSGNLDDFIIGNFTECANFSCKFGLANSVQVIQMVSAYGPIIYAGCFAATLSSALASLVSAPKVFQALCKDNLYPYISSFGRGYGKNNEPVRGYILTFFISVAVILIGNLNAIAPLISNFFLASYALINYSTFHASLVKPVGWRPTFKFYSMWLSLLGAILCCVIMLLISWVTAVITLICVLILYLIVAYRKPDVNWGSTTQAQIYKNALTAIHQLNSVEDHVKNYRPQILVFTGLPHKRPSLVDFANLLTKNLSLFICGNVLQESVPQRVRNTYNIRSVAYLKAHKIKAFYSQIDELSFEAGAKALLQVSGVGKLKPNILLMGYKSDWQTGQREQLLMYFNILHKAFDLHMAACILRIQDGFDCSKILGDEEVEVANGHLQATGNLLNAPSQEYLPRNESFVQMSAGWMEYLSVHTLVNRTGKMEADFASSVSDMTETNSRQANVNGNPNPGQQVPDSTVEDGKSDMKTKHIELYKSINGKELSKDVLNQITQFQRKQRKSTIDVWWLYDDGGLTLLLPYIISTRSNWSACKLRVFTLANKKDELEFEQRSMASLLAKFRIDYSDLTVLPDVTRKPKETTVSFFESLINDHKAKDEETYKDGDVTNAELLANQDKTNRHLRLRELLLENSMDANLIVMTLPMPRKSVVSASLYMAWLEVLTKDMPPFLLVRGNQTSVLTFYS